jgi:hypothetical protein
VGVKEIDRLIAKLQLDKEILADPDSDTASSTDTSKASDHRLGAVLITHSQKAELRKQGYSDDDIAKLKPEEAHRILKIA